MSRRNIPKRWDRNAIKQEYYVHAKKCEICPVTTTSFLVSYYTKKKKFCKKGKKIIKKYKG